MQLTRKRYTRSSTSEFRFQIFLRSSKLSWISTAQPTLAIWTQSLPPINQPAPQRDRQLQLFRLQSGRATSPDRYAGDNLVFLQRRLTPHLCPRKLVLCERLSTSQIVGRIKGFLEGHKRGFPI